MRFWRGIVGGEEVPEAPFSRNFTDFFFSWRRERVNSLTANCVPAVMKNSLSEDFLLENHTTHKHLHHDEPFFPLASWFPWMNIPHPREPLRKGLDKADIEGFSIKL